MKKLLSTLLLITLLFSCIALPTANAETMQANETTLPVIDWFTPEMTVSEAKTLAPALDSFMRDEEVLPTESVIKTGDTIITDNGNYTASVCGDVFGNGYISILSYLAIKRQVMGTLSLEGAQLSAADVDKNDRINEYDYVLAKRVYMNTYVLPEAENAKKIPVLLYHHILPDADKALDKWAGNDITIATSEFRRHMTMIAEAGLNVVTTEQVGRFVKGEILLPPDSICITFDDGYKSNTYYAAPILREFGYTATVFAIMSFYEGEYSEIYDTDALQHITRKDLENWTDVIDQQSHTWYNHNMLSEQTYAQIYNDLVLSQQSDPNPCFAYPYGNYSDTVISAVKAAGFKYAFSTVRLSATCGSDPYLIPRYTITSPLADSEFLKFLSYAE